MTSTAVDRIVRATLYEGYLLYPYRATSVKNRVRWTFGCVHAPAYAEATRGAEPSTALTQCLLRGGPDARVAVDVRFLHVLARTPALAADGAGTPEPVEVLVVDGVEHRPFEEAVERRVECGEHALAELAGGRTLEVEIPAGRDVEPLTAADGRLAGVLLRDHSALRVRVTVSADALGAEVWRVGVEVANVTEVFPAPADRPAALRAALVSTHAVLTAAGGRWLSLADPPPEVAAEAALCENAGLWPVLVDAEETTVLASPIILSDHPQVAPESAGDLFDATEIDEILSLRILTLTDEEKAAMRAADERAREMLERTELLSGDDMLRLHGVIRELRPSAAEAE